MCRHGEPELGKAVNICHLKRSAADHKETGHVYLEQLFAPQGKKVCVVGAGPAGLSAAHDLSVIGMEVTLIESPNSVCPVTFSMRKSTRFSDSASPSRPE
jgi:NADPH-dependent glutamate synthase beta subunit-like oxidoreductase